jgi:putative ABC transport system permease protein
LSPAVRRAVASLDPRLPVYNVQTMNGCVSQQVEQPRLGATLLVRFGGIALLLSAIGIYGLLSHIVSRCTRDIGVRLALGAEPSDVLRQVLGQALGLTSVGLAIGLGAAIALTRSLRALLFGVSPTDLGIFAAAALVLAAVALVAGLVPGLRASRVDPIVALRLLKLNAVLGVTGIFNSAGTL